MARKITSLVKSIGSDVGDTIKSGLQRSVARSKQGDHAEGQHRNYVVDELQLGTLAKKSAVYAGLVADDILSFAQQSREAHYEFRYRQQVRIATHDGLELCANLFAPMPKTEGETFPAIVFINSWLLDKHQYVLQARRFARSGYIVLSYSARGWGTSDGTVDIGGHNDVSDVSSTIDWLLSNTPIDASNIGFAGVSYGSGLALLGAAHDQRIKTVVGMSGWTDLFETFWAEQTPREACAKILLSTGEVAARTDPELGQLLSNLLQNKDMETVKEWASTRSPVTYMDNYNKRKLPVYLAQNFQDDLFQPNPVLDFYTRLTSPKRMDLNLGTHASAEFTGVLGMKNHVWRQTHRWFNHWLKNEENGIMDEPSVTCQYARHNRTRLSLGSHQGTRWSLDDWPPKTQRTMTLYLRPGNKGGHSNGQLAARKSRKGFQSDSLESRLGPSRATAGLPFLSSSRHAHLNLPETVNPRRIKSNVALKYESDPLAKARLILGSPSVNLCVSSSLPQLQLIAYLYEVVEKRSARLITHGPVTRHSLTPNQAIELNFKLIATCYKINPGSKLLLTFDTSDLQYQKPTEDSFEAMFHFEEAGKFHLDIPYFDVDG
ncbi:MAG: CocE/NonD family hydrolase [Pseudomonadota bacterium]